MLLVLTLSSCSNTDSWVEAHPAPGWAAQYADAANDLEAPSWTRLDLGARYRMVLDERDVTLRARLDNVTGRDYWASVGGYPNNGYLVLGAPRTFTLTASVDF